MGQTNYFCLLISNVFKKHLDLWKIIIKKWCLTTDSPHCSWWWMVQSDILHENLKRSVVDRSFVVPHVIAELLFLFLLIHNYHFLCHFNVTFLILISCHDPERHLLLAQVRGFFIVLICWKSPWANTHLEANIPSGSIQLRQPGSHGVKGRICSRFMQSTVAHKIRALLPSQFLKGISLLYLLPKKQTLLPRETSQQNWELHNSIWQAAICWSPEVPLSWPVPDGFRKTLTERCHLIAATLFPLQLNFFFYCTPET